MIPPDADSLDETYRTLLASADEALAAGAAPDPVPPAAVTPELRRRLQGAQACLRRLEQERHRRQRARQAELPAGGTAAADAHAEPAAVTPLPFGKRLGRFQLRRELGRGGCGIVYLAFDPVLDRDVALKLPRPEVLERPELRRRFLREARTAAGFDHPNLVPVYEAGEVGPWCYLVSAYCPGTTLAAWLKQQPHPVAPRRAAQVVAVLADAVHYIHQRGVVHRDIKPSNVLLETAPATKARHTELEFIPRLTDFGLARSAAGQQDTKNRDQLGTPLYMAPEQAESRHADVGPSTDVYALGVLLYEMLSGRPPFLGDSDWDTLQQIVSAEPLPPRRCRAAVPRDLETVCLKCLEKEPTRRYPSAGALAEDLRRFLGGQPVRARPARWPERTWKWARRRPALAGLMAVSVLALVGLILGAGWHSLQVSRYAGELEGLNANLKATADREHAQRQLAEERAALLRRTGYAHQVQLISHAWQKGEIVQVVEWLDRLWPEPGQEDLRGFEWYYLKGLGHPLHAVWRGHQAAVQAVAVSPDGRTVASGGFDRTVRLWDAATGKARAVLAGHTSTIFYLTFSPDGRLLASCSPDDGEVRIWEVATGAERARFLPGPGLRSVLFAPGGGQLIVGTREGVGFRDIVTGRPTGRLLKQPTPPACLAVTADGRTIAAGNEDGTVRLWDVPSARERRVLRGHSALVGCVALTPDGRALASASWDHSVKLWDLASGQSPATLARDLPGIFSLAFADDGSTLAAAAHPVNGTASTTLGTVQLWDVATRTPRNGRSDLAGQVDALAFLPGSRRLVLACADKTVKLLDAEAGPKALDLPGHAGHETWGLAFAPDGQTLASAGDDHHVRLWDPATGRQRAILEGHASLVTAVAFAPDSRVLASASFDQTVKLWDAATGRLARTLTGDGRLRCVAFSPDGRTVAAGGNDGRVQRWDAATGRVLAPLVGHAKTIRGVAFSPDGTTLASAGEGGKILLWDAATGQLRRSIGDTDEVTCLAFAPDGRTLATGNRVGLVKLWNVGTGQERLALKGHVQAVNAVAFAPGGKTLASAGVDQTVRLWQAATGEELLILNGHEARVNAVAFAPDGRTLASASHDGIVKLWRASEGGAKALTAR